MVCDPVPLVRDAALPQLALALEPGRMARFLPPGRDWSVAYLRYKPRTSCIVLYEAAGRQWAYAKLFAQDAAARVAGHAYFPEHRMAVISFPGDLAIPGLAALADPVRSNALLARITEKPRALGLRERWGEWEPVRFKPERRAVLRGVHKDRRYYLRLYAGAEGAHTEAWHNHIRRCGGPAVPRCLGYSRTFRALAVDELAGEPLLRALGVDALEATASALAHWHSLPLPAGARLLASSDLGRAARVLDALLPGAGAMQLAARLEASRPTCERPCLLHGDFYYDQVLFERDARFLDLDRLSVGDRHHDLATFCAHLVALGLPAWTSECFLAAYERAAGMALNEQAYRWHLSAALLRLADGPFRRFAPGWPAQVEALLEKARQPC